MQQSAVTDTLQTGIDSLWQGSVLHTYSVAYVGSPIQGGQYFVWSILILTLTALILKGHTLMFFNWMSNFLIFPTRRTFNDTSPAIRSGLSISLLLFLPLSAYLFYGMSFIAASYPLILGVLAAFALVKFLIMEGIAYVSYQNDFVKMMERINIVFFVLGTACFCIIFIVGMFLPDTFAVITERVIPVIAGILFILYLIEVLRIIFSLKESVFLSILYLCTLEILPIAVAVATIVKF